MAKRMTAHACSRAAVAAAGCAALLLTGCTPLPQSAGPSLPDTGGTGSSAAPLALLPATIGSTGAPAPGSAETVTSYFVLVDDGGLHGIRFGCNDSLVGAAQAGGSGDDPLRTAIVALLGGVQQPKNLYYNALDGSRLKYLSGSFDGTTVTVYLAGTLNPGGACDLPRVEAQLTQTALEAVGAVKARIYINGETLADYLRLK